MINYEIDTNSKLSGETIEALKPNFKEGVSRYFGRGKLLLSGEYFVLDGAKALALPTVYGQALTVTYRKSFSPKIIWVAKDNNGEVWLKTSFEFWRFDCLEENKDLPEVIILQKLLKKARELNSHFLREENVEVHVETQLDFPLDWGLGSSSTLIYNIAQWAYVSPFELASNTFGGSGYDIACAQTEGPLLYERSIDGPHWEIVNFNPSFKDNLYFIYLGKKQKTKDSIKLYRDRGPYKESVIREISEISDKMCRSNSLAEFEALIGRHERIVSHELDLPPVQLLYFSDYKGKIKSLGAWGGDFVMATSHSSKEETIKYFQDKGFFVVKTYDEMINQSEPLLKV